MRCAYYLLLNETSLNLHSLVDLHFQLSPDHRANAYWWVIYYRFVYTFLRKEWLYTKIKNATFANGISEPAMTLAGSSWIFYCDHVMYYAWLNLAKFRKAKWLPSTTASSELNENDDIHHIWLALWESESSSVKVRIHYHFVSEPCIRWFQVDDESWYSFVVQV